MSTSAQIPVDQELDLGVLLASNPQLRIGQNDYNINVTSNYGVTLTAEQVALHFRQHRGAGLPAHLYFHVPLCSYICHFCNYVKKRVQLDGREEDTLAEWTSLLVAESQAYLEDAEWVSKARVESFYIGGGTAALLRPHHLATLLSHVRSSYTLTDDCELTLEGNPDNFREDYIRAALDLGFNRFSVGVQSLQDEVTRFTGREHDRQMSLAALESLSRSGRPFNVDIMFGLPYQTVRSVEEDIRSLTRARVPTITIYRLRNADRQKMGIGNRSAWNVPLLRDNLQAAGVFPTLEATYAMREAAVRALLEGGYLPSPCGWWNAPGTYPDGNIPRVSRNKWQRFDTMIAYGPGAYGWLTGEGPEVVQTHNDIDIAAYSRRIKAGDRRPLSFGRLLTGHEAAAAALGFAFKANQPIELDRFRRQYGVDLLESEPYRSVFAELCERRLIEPTCGGTALRPTLMGEALHEEIISVYFHGRIGQYKDVVCRRA